MRNALIPMFALLIGGYAMSAASAPKGALEPLPESSALKTTGELMIEIHSPAADLLSPDEATSVEVEGMASTIGGVRHLDIMLVLDSSSSLRKTDPNDFRSMGAIELVQSLSPKSDTKIGVVGFDTNSELALAMSPDRDDVTQALALMKRSGSTDIAAGILAALKELKKNGRDGSSRVIILFTDGKSSKKKAREATRDAQLQGVTIQTVLLGSSKDGASILEEIALGTGGSFVQVTDPSKLPEAFRNLRTTGIDTVTLSVNGSDPIAAQLAADGSFAGSVPLQMGENRIAAMATSVDEQTRETIVTVTVQDASCATLEVAAVNDGRPALSLNERAVEIVVDASRSMWGQIDGEAKMAVTKEILHDASDWLPDDLNLALRAYGNSSPSDANDCADSLLLVPFGDENRLPIREAIEKLRPLGQTPIAYALNQAANDFAALESERVVVLVTDGIESCGGDPVAAARELRDQDITIHLIGFGLGNAKDEDTASLQAIANASGGLYVTAGSAEELKEALATTVGTRFHVFHGDSVVASGALGANESMILPEGDYRVRLDSMPPHEVDISLSSREQLTLTLEKDEGAVSHSERRTGLNYTSCENAVTSISATERIRNATTARKPSSIRF
ncbi:MAG: VWA domain-containing protein [Gammaproteobacteria bacterium]|nr:VWA domain-containing protein [Gammaproteobacteria bacterium]